MCSSQAMVFTGVCVKQDAKISPSLGHINYDFFECHPDVARHEVLRACTPNSNDCCIRCSIAYPSLDPVAARRASNSGMCKSFFTLSSFLLLLLLLAFRTPFAGDRLGCSNNFRHWVAHAKARSSNLSFDDTVTLSSSTPFRLLDFFFCGSGSPLSRTNSFNLSSCLRPILRTKYGSANSTITAMISCVIFSRAAYGISSRLLLL
mmetsp:Transcript_13700/g.19516  ORF Transcript_13700/g.19516 Transcript_13700/m.19516 type:complete len:205 (-) Transcript_13700:548-1162(-)